MANTTSWFIAPYKTRVMDDTGRVSRYCAMDDFTPQINADGGMWEETEIRGNRAVVLVLASSTTISAIAAASGIKQLPLTLLTQSLNSLNKPRKDSLNAELLDQGYTQAEINAQFGTNFSKGTFGDLLDFISDNRPEPRYDFNTNTFVFDGPKVKGKPARDLTDRVK